MVEFSPRPKVADVVTLCGTVAMMGAPVAFPDINRAAGLFLFFAGLAGIVLYPCWRWGIHYARQWRAPLFRWTVPFGEAAQLFYEAMERKGIDDITASGYSEPSVQLDHFKYVLLSDAKRGTVTLKGARLPSRQVRPIPRDEISQLMPDRNAADGLRSLSRSSPTDFQRVCVSSRHLRRAIKNRITLLKRVNEGLAG